MMSAGGGISPVGGPCGACKFLRRKCVAGCVFAPYFDSEQGAVHFAAVHKVFGASNVSKLLLHTPLHRRMEAVFTLCYEAQARLRDPVYGCVAHILSLHHQVVNLQAELAYLQAQLASLEISIPPPPSTQHMMVPPLSILDLPPASSNFDLSSLFDAPATPSPWPQRHFAAASTSAAGADLHALARELLNRQGSSSLTHVPHTATDPTHTHSSSSSMDK